MDDITATLPQAQRIQLKLRLSERLHADLKDASAKSGNSLNAEIIARLQGSLDAGDIARAVLSEIERLKGNVT